MPSETEYFNRSGPCHLTVVDWKSSHYRRCVIASLVQGVYILERDRQENRLGPQALAPPWWISFHFQVTNTLVDSADYSIFGVIFQLTLPPNTCPHKSGAPTHVIAFRGTLTEAHTRSRDILLDLKCISNRLQKSSRFQLAMRSIQNTIALAGPSNVWLAGHSLGSAIALLAGKTLTKLGYPLETYLFNSPFVSAPLGRVPNNEMIKRGIHVASSVVKAGLSATIKGRNQKEMQRNDSFLSLYEWMPRMFINPADLICSGYIGYFGHREKMQKIGAGNIEMIATQHTVGSLLSSAFDRDSEPLHLLPSAELIVNVGQSSNLRKAHGIEQWWNPHLQCQCLQYKYKL